MRYPRLAKIIRDLSTARLRTALVVLSIAVGVFAFGTIMAARTVVLEQLNSSFLAINPASATITTESFDEKLVDAVAHVPGVAAAEGMRAATARIEVGPAEWLELRLFVLPDDGERTIGTVRPAAGIWPVYDHAILIERSSLAKTNAQIGDMVRVELPNGRIRTLHLAGTTHDLSLPPAAIAGQAFGYVNEDTLEWLGGPRDFDQLQFVVAEHRDDEAYIRAIAAGVERIVERSGRPVLVTDVPPPLQHPAEAVLPTVLALLSLLGVLALLISGFLIINTISAILTQQQRQIGIMKSIGARNSQIMGIYFGLVSAFGVLALCVAWPLGALGGFGVSTFIASQLNVDIVNYRQPLNVIAIQAAAALFVPLITAALPIRSAANRTVREALSDTGISTNARLSLLDTLLARMHTLSRPTRLALRNTFRRRGRLIRTLIALSFGGAVFLSTLTLSNSLFYTLDESLAAQQYDIEILFARPYRDARVAQVAANTPGITSVESLVSAVGFPVLADGGTGEEVQLRAMPASSDFYAPKMVAGRWLLPDDDHAIVLTSNYRAKDPQAEIGDIVTLQIDDSNYEWRIVGFAEEFVPPTMPASGYVPLDAYTRALGGVGRTDTLRVSSASHDPASHAAAVSALNQQFTEAGFEVRNIQSQSDERAIIHERFYVLTGVLSMMSALIGIVGGLGLTGTMSINVLERTREIGVMRAIGASDGSIMQIVIGEGLVIGGLAWLMGVLLSLPLSYGMGYQFGMSLLNIPLTWRYSLPAVALWLVIVMGIAALASFIPARNATRLTVREVLSYE